MAIDTGSSFILGQGYVLAKMNRKTISMIDGDDLAAETLVPGKIYVLMGDGGGFLKNDVIYRDADNLAWRFLTMEKHTHFGDSNNQGGNFNACPKSSSDSSTVKPGPSVAISKSTPPGS